MAQLKDTTIDGSLVVSGAASFEDAATTRQGLCFLGHNPHGSIDNDTTANWLALGSGWCYITASGYINNQPHDYGFIENIVNNGVLVSQVWHSMDGRGTTYHRSGNASGWYANTADWVQVVDKNNVFKKIWSGTWSSDGNTIAETPNYTMFLVETKNSSTSEVQGTLIPVFKNGTFIRGVGGYVNATPTDYTYHFGATLSGNTWTLVNCTYNYHGNESTHGKRANCTPIAIYGLI